MSEAFNHDWVDKDGGSFTASSRITDDMWHTKRQIDNRSVINALSHQKLVFYGTTHHAMILIQASYYPTPGEPTIVAGTVWDPEPPNLGGGFRQVSGDDLKGYFVAIPDVIGGNGVDDDGSKGEVKTFSSLCEGMKAVISSANSGFKEFRTGKVHDHLMEDTNLKLPDSIECLALHYKSGLKLQCSFPTSQYNAITTGLSSCLNQQAGYETLITDSFTGIHDNGSLPTVTVFHGEEDTTINVVPAH
jgi:hypothetical protein